MARFEVFHNSGSHADDVPYLLDVQSDLLQGLETRVVFPCADATVFLSAGFRRD